MKLTAVAIYWVIVGLWLAVLATIVTSYLRNPKKFSAARTLLIIVAIDTVRNLVENGYFGLYFGSQYGLFASSIAQVLGDPRLLILPKLLNVAAACIVLGLMVMRWLPTELANRERAEQEIRETSDALRHEEEERRNLFESSVDLILITDRRGTIVRANPSSLANLGYSPAEMLGKSAADFIYPPDLDSTRAEMRSARTGRHTRNFETRYIHKDGRILTFGWSGVWSEPEQKHFFFGRDVSDRKMVEQRLDHLAHTDQLTGLPNRLKLQSDLGALLGEDTGHGGSVAGHSVSVALLDLDDFKDINDTLGQTVGDGVLKEIAARLRQALTCGSNLYRVGGDEFVVVFEDRFDPLSLSKAVEALVQAVAVPMKIDEQRLFVRASAGIAIAPEAGGTVDAVIASADLALQESKAAGGGLHRLFVPSLRAQAQARRLLDLDLRRAYGDQQFELFFQPQVRVSDGAIVGAEALLRWRHPERGLIAPAAFIDALARNAISLDVGGWILRSACEQAARWQSIRPSLRIGVNIFPAQFHGHILVDDVEKALRASGLPASALEIEITENIALRQDDDILTPLHTLREAGISLAFDDFGTGYASLSFLRRYPLSRIKIDKSFIQKIEQEGSLDAAIVRSIITMSHNLNLGVIAEGVETRQQAEFLKREGCEEAQGFLYGRPVPASKFERMLRDSRTRAGRAVA